MIKNINNQKGAALVSALVFLMILTVIGIALTELTLTGFKYINQSHTSVQAQDIAEGGIHKALYELNKPGSTYTGETDTVLGNGTFTVQVATIDPNTKTITSTGYIPNRTAYQMQKTIRVTLYTESSSTKIAFKYATQIGTLGLSMNSNARINGNAYSNGNITGSANSSISGDAYAVGTISSPAPTASSKHPGSPPAQIPTVDYNFWKTEAAKGGTSEGDYLIGGNQQVQLGPKKIHGNFTMQSNSQITLEGPIYVTGNFLMDSNSRILLDNAFGSAGTIIIVDGTVTLNSNSYIYPTDSTPKGYLLLVTTSTTSDAMTLSSNSSNAICYVLEGSMMVNSNGKARAAVAKGLTLNSNATFDYDVGLADSIFTTGPGGAWVIKPGSWQKL